MTRSRVVAAIVAMLAAVVVAAGACSDDDDAPEAAGDLSAPAATSLAITATDTPPPTVSGDGRITLIAGGDVMLGRSLGEGILQNGTRWPFEFVSSILGAADIAFVNLETAVSWRGEPVNKDFTFRAPPEAAVSLADAGIDIVSLANNHAYDYGPEALIDTMTLVQAEGVATVGAGEDLASATQVIVLEIKGVRVAFLAYVNTPPDGNTGYVVEETQATETTPGVNWLYAERVPNDVELAKTVADVVVVSVHTGFEYQEALSDLQTQVARSAIDAGAALVLGHHPHVLQGIETYNGGLIVYSLGNFVFDFDYVDYAYDGLPSALSAMVEVDLTKDGVAECRVVPMIVGEEDGRPRPVMDAEAQPVLDRLARLSDGSCGL